MAIEIVVPRLGWSMDEGTFAEWLKKEGDFVSAGDMLFVLEGEKSSQEIESFDSGILSIPPDAPQPGDTVVVGQRLGFLLAAGEVPPQSAGARSSQTSRRAVPVVPTRDGASDARRTEGELFASKTTRAVASPRARRKARELGIVWTSVPGSGRNGRVRERDVINFANQSRSPGLSEKPAPHLNVPGSLQPASFVRQTVAQRMIAAVQQTAAVTLMTKVDASGLVLARQQCRESGAEIVPTYNEILLKLVAESLRECPELNACWHDDAIYVYHEINIAIAVDTDWGLMAPVLRNVASLSIDEIATRSRWLIEQTRLGLLPMEEYYGGTFTITNLGMLDIDFFTPIINLPQSAILGVGRIADEPVIAGGQVVPGKVISLSLTFDHRVIDGAPAARWLQRLAQGIGHSPDRH